MKVFLSREWRISMLGIFLIPICAIVVLGFLKRWTGMAGFYALAVGYGLLLLLVPSRYYSTIIIGEKTIMSKVHFFKQCEVNCGRRVYYGYFEEEISGVSKKKYYILLSNNVERLPIQRPYLANYSRENQIVIPYTKETEQVLEKWLSCENWTCVGGMKPDLNAPPSPPPPPPPRLLRAPLRRLRMNTTMAFAVIDE